MKKALLLSAAALLLAVSCTRRPVRPAFGTVSVDTLLGDSGAGCRIEYRFATILNAAESPALQAVEQANIRYFFQTGEQTGSVREAIAAAVRDRHDLHGGHPADAVLRNIGRSGGQRAGFAAHLRHHAVELHGRRTRHLRDRIPHLLARKGV